MPCNDGVTQITDIVDNRAAEGFVAEHGLSLLIERGDERILFDTGAGAALRPNAAKLGIELGGVTRIVLSHSHNDHAGGLGGLMPKCPIHVGEGNAFLSGRVGRSRFDPNLLVVTIREQLERRVGEIVRRVIAELPH